MAAQVASGSLFLRLMSASVAIANHAGNIIRDIMQKGNLGIVEKGINDLQTEADRSAQRCIVNSLLKQFPKITVIGEETLEKVENEDDLVINLNDCEAINTKCPENLVSVKEEDVVIWVDPLDGTAEYTQGLLDHVTVLIGLAVNGKAVGGVIHQPYYNYQVFRTYLQTEEFLRNLIHYYGATKKFPSEFKSKIEMRNILQGEELLKHESSVQRNQLQRTIRPIFCPKEEDYSKLGRTMWGIVGVGGFGIQHVHPPEDKRIIATTRSHSNPLINSTIAALKPDEILKVGGAGHKVLLLIEGKAHAYVFPSKGCKKWDTCAPEALLHAFGGKLTDIKGKPIQYHSTVEHVNSGGVLATYLESIHDWYVTNIPKEAKDSLQ